MSWPSEIHPDSSGNLSMFIPTSKFKIALSMQSKKPVSSDLSGFILIAYHFPDNIQLDL